MNAETKSAAAVPVEIRHWNTGAVLFRAEVDASLPATGGWRLGAALQVAANAGARLDGARLDGASLVGASLARTIGAFTVGYPDGFHLVVVRHADGIRIAAGCKWLTFAAAVKRFAGRDERQECRAALAYIRAVVEIKGWTLGEDPGTAEQTEV